MRFYIHGGKNIKMNLKELNLENKMRRLNFLNYKGFLGIRIKEEEVEIQKLLEEIYGKKNGKLNLHLV